MNRRVVRLLAALGAVLATAACTPGGGSIYYTLENEVKVEDFSLPNDMTVFDVARIGTTYYAAAGKIWKADVGAASFQVDDLLAPPGGEGATQLCTALAALDGNLYGGFVGDSGNLGLYKATVDVFNATPVADPLVAGAQVALLKVENSQLAVVTARPSGDSFAFTVVVGDGSAFAEPPFLAARPADDKLVPISDVIYSSRLAAWFVTEGAKLFSDSPTVTMAGITAGEELTGLFDDGTNIFIASRAGAIYHSPDGASWTRIAAPTVSGAHPPLTRFGGVLGGTHLLVGSDGYGYYRLDTTNLAGGTVAVTRSATTTSDLYTAAVRDLVVDGATVFALTGGRGLWRGIASGADVADWQQE